MRSTVEGSSAVAVAGRLVSVNSATSPSSVPGPTVSVAAVFAPTPG